MFKALFKSLQKSRRLKKISSQLAKPLNRDILTMSKDIGEKEVILNQLIALCTEDELAVLVMSNVGATEQTLMNIYHKLRDCGAGQYVAGHYVAASSLAFLPTLTFLVYHFKEGEFSIKGYDAYNSGLFVADRLITYFQKGEVDALRY